MSDGEQQQNVTILELKKDIQLLKYITFALVAFHSPQVLEMVGKTTLIILGVKVA